jgi:class I lanthipeptide synthase
VRFAGDPELVNGALLGRLSAAAAEAIDAGLTWRLQLDTYEREIERYGGDDGIALAERLFTADSDATLAIVETTPRDDGAIARWQLALRGIDQLLAAFELPLAARAALVTRMRDSFGVEHGLDTALQRQLGERFRTHRAAIAELLAVPDDAGESDHDLAPGIAALAARGAVLRPMARELRAAEAAGRLDRSVDVLLDSYVHMHVNRMLTAAHRRQELVLYDLLRRHYDGIRARAPRR